MDKDKIMDLSMTVLRNAPSMYARSYAESLGRIIYAGASDEDTKTQTLYVLSNLSTWRGELARETKKSLKEAIK